MLVVKDICAEIHVLSKAASEALLPLPPGGSAMTIGFVPNTGGDMSPLDQRGAEPIDISSDAPGEMGGRRN